ncbi:MAG: hypothetical protein Q9196_006174 [Gyalolechia fulgens]
MNSNSMPATFWLVWHMMRDRQLLTRAVSEINACRMGQTTSRLSFDTRKLCDQPLLQSSYAETLRMYVAVYIIRKPIYEDAQLLQYTIPKEGMMVISSAMAHMDERNWNLGTLEEHPVESFWADRFLTYDRPTASPSSASPGYCTDSTSVKRPGTLPSSAACADGPAEAKFSLNGYGGAWIPFGGGIHQCPGRHWVKLQMLLSFAMISAAFDIELLAPAQDLKVDMAKYGLGALQPAEKVKFKIKRRSNAV